MDRDHNIWDYLSFMIHIQDVDPFDYTPAEKYVRNLKVWTPLCAQCVAACGPLERCQPKGFFRRTGRCAQ